MSQEEPTSESNPDETALIRVRNDFIDAFADLESLICRIIQSCGRTPSNEPFGQRLQAFRTVEKTTFICKESMSQRDKIADEIAKLLSLRADVIHSRMRVAKLDGSATAIFVNAQDAYAKHPAARIITLAEFQELCGKLRQVREKIAGLGRKPNPPSSPPPPSPAAAGGP